MSNINPNQDIDIEVQVNEYDLEDCEIRAKILRNEQLNAHNTFESPESVKPGEFSVNNFNMEAMNLYFKMPSKAVLIIEIKQ
ncbi:MAG: hypothetical protein ACFFE4_20305 [Candidatus Thorarchaeota archaeon]